MDDAQRKPVHHGHQRHMRMPGDLGLQGGGAMGTQALDQLLRNGELGLLPPATVFGFVIRTVPATFLLPQRLGLFLAQQPAMHDHAAHVVE
ncbi:hypothetical protein D3C71_1705230 [compost metagenome]